MKENGSDRRGKGSDKRIGLLVGVLAVLAFFGGFFYADLKLPEKTFRDPVRYGELFKIGRAHV